MPQLHSQALKRQLRQPALVRWKCSSDQQAVLLPVPTGASTRHAAGHNSTGHGSADDCGELSGSSTHTCEQQQVMHLCPQRQNERKNGRGYHHGLLQDNSQGSIVARTVRLRMQSPVVAGLHKKTSSS